MIIDENNKIASEKLLNKSSKLTDVEKSEYFKKFYELDPTSSRYPDNPKNLITLIKWFLEDPVERQYTLIKLEYETYLEQSRLNQWRGVDVVIKDIAKFPNFRAFAEEVHRIDSKYRKSDSKGGSSEIKDTGSKIEVAGKSIDKKDITYMTDEVVVARADTMQKSIRYGSGFSSWCTARSSGNYFYEYRFGSYGDVGESTMYYVYFPKRYSENPNNDDTVLHFGVNEEGDISFTNRSNSERVETLSWLKNEYPEFKDVSNMYEIFPHTKITSSERKVRDLPDNMSDSDFLTLSNEDKLMYLQSSSNRVINLNKFKTMSDDMKSNYLGIVENSGLFLDIDILNIIKKTSMGRRYLKNIPNNILDDILRRYIHLKNPISLIEIIHLIIESKKDDIDIPAIVAVLAVVFDQYILPAELLDIGKRLGESNLNKLFKNNVKDLLLPNYKAQFETRVEVLGDTNINKLNHSTYLSDLVTSYTDYNSDKMIRFVLKRFDYVMDFRLVEAILGGLSEIKSNDKLDIQSVIFQLIDNRKKFNTPFDANVITSFVKYTTNTSEVMARIGESYNVNNIDSKSLLKLMNVMNRKNSLGEFEKHFAKNLLTLTKENINAFLSNIDNEYRPDPVPKIKLLLKYTVNNWTSDQMTLLVTTTANHDDYGKERDLIIENYLKTFGVGRWNEFSEKDLVGILPTFSDILSTIENVFGKEFILSKLRARDFAKIYVPSSITGAFEKNEKLLEFVVKHYELTSNDILTHLRYFPIDKFESIVGTQNITKLTSDDLFILLNNNYIGSSTFETYVRRYIDNVLQLSPDQISSLLNLTVYSSLKLFDLLLERNYNFTNDQLVQFIIKTSKSIYNNAVGFNTLSGVLEKLGKDKIQSLGNDALVKLGENNTYSFEKFLDYVSIDSLNSNAIRTFLRAAYNRSDFYNFKRVFERLKSVVNKLTSEDIVYLMTLGGDLVMFFLDYVTDTNPSAFTLDFIELVLKNASESKIYKTFPDQIFRKIGKENVNKALDVLDELQLNTLLLGVPHSSYGNYNHSFAISLIMTMSESNLSKISDASFKEIAGNLTGSSYRDSVIRKLLTKSNLNGDNMFHLLRSAPVSFLKFEFKSYKPILDQLDANKITELLIGMYNMERMGLLFDLIGNNNLNKLNEIQIYNVLTASIYGKNKSWGRKLLVYFRKSLNKLSPDMMLKLKTSPYFEPSEVDVMVFIGDGKFTSSFLSTIKNGNYTFLKDFTDLYFNNIDNIQTPINYYLRVLGEYIRTHNNTLNYTEFEVIIRMIEESPDVVNAVLQFLSKVLKTKLYTYLNTYNKGRKYNDKVVKEYKRYYSDLLFEDSSFSKENLDKALDIERKAYPPHMQLINSYIEQGGTLDIYDIADYLECSINDIVFHMGSNWFILGCKKGNELEIADWASDGGMSPGAVKTFFSVLSQYRDKTITCSARETTSYKLIKNAEKLGYVTVLEEEEWSWGGVKMVDLKFRFSDKFMNRINKGKKTNEVP
jgi:hypothetical protein